MFFPVCGTVAGGADFGKGGKSGIKGGILAG